MCRNIEWSRCCTSFGGLKGNRAINAVLGGWNLGVLETYESGPAFTVITMANTTNAFLAGKLN